MMIVLIACTLNHSLNATDKLRSVSRCLGFGLSMNLHVLSFSLVALRE